MTALIRSGAEVTIADDGLGIGPDVVAGVGLLSLRERAEELGGQCEVVCPEEGGTTVRALLPYGLEAAVEVGTTVGGAARLPRSVW